MTEQTLQVLEYLADLNINTDAIKKEMKEKEMEKILEQHSFAITQGKDGRWRTYISDKTHPTGRRQIAKSTEEKIHEMLYQHYTNEHLQYTDITLRKLFPQWSEHKKIISTAETNFTRIHYDWKKYYENSPIIDIPIKKLSKLEITEWFHITIKDNKMSRHQYDNFSLIIRQMLQYAVSKEIIHHSPCDGIKIDSRLLRRIKKPESHTQVYTIAEEQELFELANKDFSENTRRIKYPLTPLAIMFQFKTGLRVGELCALKYEDLSDNGTLHIQRMYQRDTKKIIDQAKTMDGNREIPLSSTALDIIKQAKAYQEEHGIDTTGYIFSVNNHPLSPTAVNDALKKYCKQINTTIKRSHKVRKTCISSLFDADINIDSIRRFAGHADERTTYNCYCFDRTSDSDRNELIKKALS